MGSGEDSIIQGSGSKTNKQRFEALEENQDRILKSLLELTKSIAHLTRSNNDTIERLERQLAENKGKETIDEPKPIRNHERFKQGGRVERGPLIVERWLHDEVSEREIDDGTEEDARLDRRPRDRMPIHRQRREPWRDTAEYEGDRRRERHHSRGPRKPKVDFPHFNGGDPYEWLDKMEHYFQVYEVARVNWVSTACIYLDGKANSWWRWIKAQY
ncbi:hypothetical protein LWI28_008291 [Acer negundo]|uniref:Retrotransposon gag domain-containing protein n=1 Tax=Acer negundo TaxID=4023 RepID=A0AAD5IA14_ACENE|nr:hypothetical protein LWI28_008291 [Acer negundo]